VRKSIVLHLAFLSGFAALPLHTTAAQTTAPQTADGDEPTQSEREWYRSIEQDLVAEKFGELDRMADDLRHSRERFSGGQWKLRAFYQGLDKPHVTDKDDVDHLEHLRHWMTQRPESITARVALATSLTRWAWVARGNGTADKVTEEGWTLFNQRIAEAKSVLDNSRNMHVMCPQWFSEMMTVGLAQGWSQRQVEENFQRGIQFEPEYYYLYRQYANYLLPKWYGKQSDAATFAATSADRLGGDRGDILYYQISTVLVRRGNGSFRVDGIDWPRIQRGALLLNQQYGHVHSLHNELAFMAYKFNDPETAKKYFALIGDNWARGVWKDRDFFDRIRDWSTDRTQWP